MPNWCQNEVSISGPEENIARVKDHLNGHEAFCLNKIKPIPDELRGTRSPNDDQEKAEYLQKKYGHSSWYSWCVANWGTKWNTVDASLRDFSDHLFYTFHTAWSPPISAIQQLAEDYPELRIEIEYDEPGCDFWGRTVFVGGEITREEEGPSLINQEAFEEEAEYTNERLEDLPDDDF